MIRQENGAGGIPRGAVGVSTEPETELREAHET